MPTLSFDTGRGSLPGQNTQSIGLRNLSCLYLYLVGHVHFSSSLPVNRLFRRLFCIPPFLMQLHMLPRSKPTLNHHFSSLSHPFPILAFASSRDLSSGFPVPHQGIRGFSKWGVGQAGSSLRCTAPCRLHFCFLRKRKKFMSVASLYLHSVYTMFSMLVPPLELCLCSRWVLTRAPVQGMVGVAPHF